MIINMSAVTGFCFVLIRMTGCILFNPILGRRNFPALFRAGMILIFSLVIYSYTDVNMDPPHQIIPLVVGLLSELLIGFVMGFVVNLFAYAVLLGGSFIDYQMGLSIASIYDPQSNISMSLSSSYYNMMFVFLFFQMNGHLALIRLFLTMGNVIPYGHMTLNPELSTGMLDVFVRCTVLGITLAMPMIAIQFLMEIAVGILMKAIPQINVFAVNLQAKVMLGLLVMLVFFGPLASLITSMLGEMIDTIQKILMLMQGS